MHRWEQRPGANSFLGERLEFCYNDRRTDQIAPVFFARRRTLERSAADKGHAPGEVHHEAARTPLLWINGPVEEMFLAQFLQPVSHPFARRQARAQKCSKSSSVTSTSKAP